MREQGIIEHILRLADASDLDARRALSGCMPALPLENGDWMQRCKAHVADIWLRILLDTPDAASVVPHRAVSLRQKQIECEGRFLKTLDIVPAKRAALELIALYHLVAAGEKVAKQSSLSDLRLHFEHADKACDTNLLRFGQADYSADYLHEWRNLIGDLQAFAQERFAANP